MNSLALAVRRTARYIYTSMYENFRSRCHIIQNFHMITTFFPISDDCILKFKHWQEKEPKMDS